MCTCGHSREAHQHVMTDGPCDAAGCWCQEYDDPDPSDLTNQDLRGLMY
jgi:hypothetical protein